MTQTLWRAWQACWSLSLWRRIWDSWCCWGEALAEILNKEAWLVLLILVMSSIKIFNKFNCIFALNLLFFFFIFFDHLYFLVRTWWEGLLQCDLCKLSLLMINFIESQFIICDMQILGQLLVCFTELLLNIFLDCGCKFISWQSLLDEATSFWNFVRLISTIWWCIFFFKSIGRYQWSEKVPISMHP